MWSREAVARPGAGRMSGSVYSPISGPWIPDPFPMKASSHEPHSVSLQFVSSSITQRRPFVVIICTYSTIVFSSLTHSFTPSHHAALPPSHPPLHHPPTLLNRIHLIAIKQPADLHIELNMPHHKPLPGTPPPHQDAPIVNHPPPLRQHTLRHLRPQPEPLARD